MNTKGKQFWIVLQALIYCFCGLCFAVYPAAPGTYYSVLLRYNSRGKTRKVARIAPTPQRLWAYFNPPAALGAMPLEAIDNSIRRHIRNRGMAGRLAETPDQSKTSTYNSAENIPSNKNLENQIKAPSKFGQKRDHQQPKRQQSEYPVAKYRKEDASAKSEFALTSKPQESEGTEKPPKENMMVTTPKTVTEAEKEDANATQTTQALRETNTKPTTTIKEEIEGSCGGTIKISLTPTKEARSKKQGRFFQKTIKSIGFPTSYETGRRCVWAVEVSDECQMGMVVHEIHEGNILQSNQCYRDSLNIVFNGKERERLCGPLKGHIGSYKWTQSGYQYLNFTWKTMGRAQDAVFPEDKRWGFKLTVSGYCWVYSAKYLSRFIQKELHGKRRRPVKPLRIKDEGERNPLKPTRPPPPSKNDSETAAVETFGGTRNDSIVPEELKIDSHTQMEGKEEHKGTPPNEGMIDTTPQSLEYVATDDVTTPQSPENTIADQEQVAISINKSEEMESESKNVSTAGDSKLTSTQNGASNLIDRQNNGEGSMDTTKSPLDSNNGDESDEDNVSLSPSFPSGDDEATTTLYAPVETMEETELKGVTSAPILLKW